MKYFVFFATIVVSTSVADEEIEEFVKLFHQKRLHQLTAIKSLLNMNPTRCLSSSYVNNT